MNSNSKLVIFVAALALGALGCVSTDDPIRLLGVRSLTGDAESCEASDIQLVAGSLDVSGTTFYVAQFDMESSLQQLSSSSGGETIAGANRNDFFADEVVLSYTSTPSQPFEEERVPMHFVLPPGASRDDSFLRMNIIGPKAAQRLVDNVTPGNTLDLVVTLEVRGHLASGQDVSSNPVSYPISIFNSGFAGCTSPLILAGTGPCGLPGGQDGSRPGCIDPTATP